MTRDEDLRAVSVDFALRALNVGGIAVSGGQVVAEAGRIYEFLLNGPRPSKNNAVARKRNKRKAARK